MKGARLEVLAGGLRKGFLLGLAAPLPLVAAFACSSGSVAGGGGDAGADALLALHEAGKDVSIETGDGGSGCDPNPQVQPSGYCDPQLVGSCSYAYTYDCGAPLTTTQCTCVVAGHPAVAVWGCDVPPPPTCYPGNPTCPVFAPGAACSDYDASCTSAYPAFDCSGDFIGRLTCACTGSTWTCTTPASSCSDAAVPPQPCPDPATIQQGAACSGTDETCPGNPTACPNGPIVYDAFECSAGKWNDVLVGSCS